MKRSGIQKLRNWILGLIFTLIILPAQAQNFADTLYTDFFYGSAAISGLPDAACTNQNPNGFYVQSGWPCWWDDSCVPGLINSVPLSDRHILNTGDTLNLSLTFDIPNNSYNEGWVHVKLIENIGTPQESTTVLIDPFIPECILSFGFCTPNTYNFDVFANVGSLNSALVIHLNNTFYGTGTYALPIVSTGPLVQEIPSLGSIVTPQIPYLILHDPPGDLSYSEFQSATTVCRSSSTTYESSNGAGANVAVKTGIAGSLGVILEQDFEFSVEVSTDFMITKTNTNSNEEETCLETVNTFQTSDLPGFIGDEGDVFIGYGETLNWGVYNVLTYDGCVIDSIKQLAYYPDPNGYTTFIRSAIGIQSDINYLETILNNTANSPLIRTRAANQIEVWQDLLALNDANKANAVNTAPIGNYNFEGGIPSSYSEGITTTQIKSTSYNVATDVNSAINIVAMVGANGATGGPQISFSKNEGSTTTTSNVNAEIVSYTLNDDDMGDIFNCTAYKDPDYGTPIFRLNPGSLTSCPHEASSTPRDSFTIEAKARNGCDTLNWTTEIFVDNVNTSNNVATFDVEICNTSPSTAFDADREFRLGVTNNSNGLSVSAGATVLNNTGNNYTETVNKDSCHLVTVTMQRNPLLALPGDPYYQPSDDVYDNVKLQAWPDCFGADEEEVQEVVINLTFFRDGDYPNADRDCDGVSNEFDNCVAELQLNNSDGILEGEYKAATRIVVNDNCVFGSDLILNAPLVEVNYVNEALASNDLEIVTIGCYNCDYVDINDNCTNSSSTAAIEWIDSFVFGAFTNNASGSAIYSDYTDLSINPISPGASIQTSITPGFSGSTYTENFQIWIDFNFDNAFDASELVFSGTGTTLVSGTVQVPNYAGSGATIMRVQMNFDTNGNSCGVYSYGETEDYKLILLDANGDCD